MSERALIVSSDGHAVAPMPAYREYLPASHREDLGAAGVTLDEARLMVGQNAIRTWGFDGDALRKRADEIGPSLDELLTPPTQDFFPRGDVHKPLATAF